MEQRENDPGASGFAAQAWSQPRALEAYRDQLQFTIASQERETEDLLFWLRLLMLAVLACGALLLFLADTISPIGLVWTFAIGVPLLFILTLRVNIFGEPYCIGILVVGLLLGVLGHDGLMPGFLFLPDTKQSARALLADCEAKISRLKDKRS